MKTIILKGGLGNQMFQYAYGRNLEVAGKKIVFDTSFFNGAKAKVDTARDFKLSKFNIQTKAAFVNTANPLLKFMNRVRIKLGWGDFGYWQNEKYFKNIETNIQTEFTLKQPLTNKYSDTLNHIINTSSVSLHIRRGDYVNDKKTKAFHNVCDLKYYERAVDIIKAKINNPTFFIFSDDIEWVRDNLNITSPVFWVSSLKGEDYEELTLMSLCKHNIIANSTFSWWGAWLNKNPTKIVIAPKQWSVNKTSDETGILPKSWIQT